MSSLQETEKQVATDSFISVSVFLILLFSLLTLQSTQEILSTKVQNLWSYQCTNDFSQPMKNTYASKLNSLLSPPLLASPLLSSSLLVGVNLILIFARLASILLLTYPQGFTTKFMQ